MNWNSSGECVACAPMGNIIVRQTTSSLTPKEYIHIIISPIKYILSLLSVGLFV